MKILITPASQFITGLTLALIVMFYQLYFEIKPIQIEIKVVEKENAALKLQLQAKKNLLQQMGTGMSSQDFYTWFMKENFTSLKLQALSGDSQNVHIMVAGNPSNILPFLLSLAGSRFINFNFSEVQTGDAKLDMHFSFLKVDAVPAAADQKALPSQMHIRQTQHVIGRVSKNGEKFCVIENGNKIVLRREAC